MNSSDRWKKNEECSDHFNDEVCHEYGHDNEESSGDVYPSVEVEEVTWMNRGPALVFLFNVKEENAVNYGHSEWVEEHEPEMAAESVPLILVYYSVNLVKILVIGCSLHNDLRRLLHCQRLFRNAF